MDNQEIFDKVTRHLATMTHRAMDDAGGNCAYEAYRYDPCLDQDVPTGDKCAIGGILPEEVLDDVAHYDGGVKSLCDNYSAVYEFFGLDELDYDDCESRLDLLERLQNAHDGAPNWRLNDNGLEVGYDNWAVLADIAEDYGLSTAVLEEVTREAVPS